MIPGLTTSLFRRFGSVSPNQGSSIRNHALAVAQVGKQLAPKVIGGYQKVLDSSPVLVALKVGFSEAGEPLAGMGKFVLACEYNHLGFEPRPWHRCHFLHHFIFTLDQPSSPIVRIEKETSCYSPISNAAG